jgi:hypothetical protein
MHSHHFSHSQQQRGFLFSSVFCVVLLVLGLLAQSCGSQQQEAFQGFALYGGKSRANNFTANGTFSASLTFQERAFVSQIDKTTKIPGAAAQLIPVSFATAYIPMLDGSVARVSNKLLEWRAPLDGIGGVAGSGDSRAVIASSSVADRADNFYGIASDGALYSIAADGKRRWKLPLFASIAANAATNAVSPATYTDVLLLGDGVVVGGTSTGVASTGGTSTGGAGSSYTLVKVSFDGAVLWKREFTAPLSRTFAADDQDNIIVAVSSSPNALVSVAPTNGKVRWSLATDKLELLRMPVVAGSVAYIGAWKSAGTSSQSGVSFVSPAERVPVLLAVDVAKGTLLWTRTLLVPAMGIAANAEMVVVAGSQLGLGEPYTAIVAYAAHTTSDASDASESSNSKESPKGEPQKGRELWRKGFALQVASVPMISKDNIAFVGSTGEAVGVYYLKKDGTFSSVFSISDMPPMFLQPAVDYDCNMVFATTEDLGVVKIGRSPAQKLLPY